MSDQLTAIYRAQNVPQAHLLKGLLADAGIEATVTNEQLADGAGVDVVGWRTQPQLVVTEENAERARQIATEFDKNLASMPEETAGEEADTFEGGVAWPVCPQCGQRRTTRCPVCETAGSDFPPSDAGYTESAETLLICPTCDEPFEPTYLGRCEWCGHAFDDGYPAEPVALSEPLSARTIGVIVALLAVVGLLLAYFVALVA